MNAAVLLQLLLVIGLAFAGAGCTGRSDAAVSDGKALFTGYGCNTCHIVNGQGGKLGPDLTTIGFRKNEQWLDTWLKDPHQWKPGTLMPNFYLNDQNRKALVAYLASLKGQEYRDNPPWNKPELMENPVKRGEAIYHSVGCVGCHGHSGKGKYPNNNVVGGQIPALTAVADGYSKEELKEKIKMGVPEPAPADPNQPAPMIHMPSWGQYLKDDEMDAVVEYLYSLRPASSGDSW